MRLSALYSTEGELPYCREPNAAINTKRSPNKPYICDWFEEVYPKPADIAIFMHSGGARRVRRLRAGRCERGDAEDAARQRNGAAALPPRLRYSVCSRLSAGISPRRQGWCGSSHRSSNRTHHATCRDASSRRARRPGTGCRRRQPRRRRASWDRRWPRGCRSAWRAQRARSGSWASWARRRPT